MSERGLADLRGANPETRSAHSAGALFAPLHPQAAAGEVEQGHAGSQHAGPHPSSRFMLEHGLAESRGAGHLIVLEDDLDRHCSVSDLYVNSCPASARAQATFGRQLADPRTAPDRHCSVSDLSTASPSRQAQGLGGGSPPSPQLVLRPSSLPLRLPLPSQESLHHGHLLNHQQGHHLLNQKVVFGVGNLLNQ